MPVDIMPGEFDPCNYVWPQQPLHACMFPQTRVYSTFKNVTNPYDAVVAGVRYDLDLHTLEHQGKSMSTTYTDFWGGGGVHTSDVYYQPLA